MRAGQGIHYEAGPDGRLRLIGEIVTPEETAELVLPGIDLNTSYDSLACAYSAYADAQFSRAKIVAQTLGSITSCGGQTHKTSDIPRSLVTARNLISHIDQHSEAFRRVSENVWSTPWAQKIIDGSVGDWRTRLLRGIAAKSRLLASEAELRSALAATLLTKVLFGQAKYDQSCHTPEDPMEEALLLPSFASRKESCLAAIGRLRELEGEVEATVRDLEGCSHMPQDCGSRTLAELIRDLSGSHSKPEFVASSDNEADASDTTSCTLCNTPAASVMGDDNGSTGGQDLGELSGSGQSVLGHVSEPVDQAHPSLTSTCSCSDQTDGGWTTVGRRRHPVQQTGLVGSTPTARQTVPMSRSAAAPIETFNSYHLLAYQGSQ